MGAEAEFSTTPAVLAEDVLPRPGCPIHYWTAGPVDATAILLGHGATADHRMFNAQLPALLDGGYRVVVWDARGHGSSVPMPGMPTIDDYVQDLLALVDVLGLDQPILLGQSLGSYVAQHAVQQRPDDWRGLISIGGIAVFLPTSWTDLAVLRSTPAMLRIWPWDSFCRLAARQAAVRAEVQTYMADCLSTIDKPRFLRIWHAVITAVSRTGFGGFPELPILWTSGDHDRHGAVGRDARRVADRARVVTIPAAGHNANQDNPAGFNAELLDFLTT